jgi:hypothetical protein
MEATKATIAVIGLVVLLAWKGRPASRRMALRSSLLGSAVYERRSTRRCALLDVTIYQPPFAGLLSGGNGRVALWRPALTFLSKHSTLGFRIEAVPTAGHWEAYYFPRANYALARGWYRQLDLSLNRVLYSPSLTPSTYRDWLHRRAVEFVLLPHKVGLDGRGALPEARLLSTGRSGLRKLFDRGGWTIYAVPRATPILSGPFASAITNFGHDRIEGWVAASGRYRLLVRHTPFWAASDSVCVAPGCDGMSTLIASRAGRFSLVASIRSLAGADSSSCWTTARRAPTALLHLSRWPSGGGMGGNPVSGETGSLRSSRLCCTSWK